MPPENDIARAISAAPDPSPIGVITTWAGPSNLVPIGWLICNGDQVLQSQFPALCQVIQDSWGPRDSPSGQHRLPDLRGMFIRGVNGSRTDQFADPEREGRVSNNGRSNEVGSTQIQELKRHGHGVTDPSHTHNSRVPKGGGSSGKNGSEQGLQPESTSEAKTGITINDTGGSETRPNNAYIYYIIKAL